MFQTVPYSLCFLSTRSRGPPSLCSNQCHGHNQMQMLTWHALSGGARPGRASQGNTRLYVIIIIVIYRCAAPCPLATSESWCWCDTLVLLDMMKPGASRSSRPSHPAWVRFPSFMNHDGRPSDEGTISRHTGLQLGNVTEQRQTPEGEGVTSCGQACFLHNLRVWLCVALPKPCLWLRPYHFFVVREK